MIQNLDIAKLQRIAAQLKEVVPKHSLMIAGGAPRDILNGRPVKDIDVFIGLDGDDNQMANDWFQICTDVLDLYPQHSESLFERHKDKKMVWCQTQGSYEASGALNLINAHGYSYGAFSLVEFPQGPYCHSLQLVFIDMDPVENVRNHFDFGLSKVWVTPNQVRMDKAYWHDHFGQRITYLNSTEPNEQRRLSSIERVKRLRQKYQGWRFERCWPLDNPVLATPVPVVEEPVPTPPPALPCPPGFTPWAGGACPVVGHHVSVEYIMRGPSNRNFTERSECLRWSHNSDHGDIIAYKVL